MDVEKISESRYGIPYISIKNSLSEMRVLCLSSTCEHRGLQALTSEPETIAWLNTLQEADLLIDVGANIGIYSLYASIFRKSKVVALEPELENYRSIWMNRMVNEIGSDQFEIYPFACGSKSEVTKLFVTNPFEAGGSMNSVDLDLNDSLLMAENPRAHRVVYKTRLDEICIDCEFERLFIKIDVDGLEKDVLLGSIALLEKESRLHSILIELDRSIPQHLQAIQFIESFGFGFDPAQVNASNSYIKSSWPQFPTLANYIFYRK
ncbi:MAG: FkbM family methyltransferase [Leptolyngbyaceae bacterium]|nr:FkbM family methyltransferase [Leptolyngbyaceae bacterium]